MNCEHIHVTRVASFGGGTRPPQDGVFTYYCEDCKLTLYVRFLDAPLIVVTYDTPPQEAQR